MKTINFFTVSDKAQYDMFIIPFIYSILHHIETGYCEILMKDSKSFLKKYVSPLSLLKGVYGDRFIIRDIPDYYDTAKLNYKYIGQIIRFLEVPTLKCDYTYIGDIDIITFDSDIIDQHEKLMATQELHYSNIVRENSQRLTGCIFTKTVEYYNAIEPMINKFKNNPVDVYFPILNDEILLYHLVKPVLGLPKYNTAYYRPIHGIHISLNRPTPFGDKETSQLGWGINEKRMKQYNAFRSSQVFNQIHSYFTDEFKTFIKLLDEINL